MKKVIQLDVEKYFVGFTTADESPLEPGVFLMPANTIDAPEPSIPDGFIAKWNVDDWIYEPIPEIEPEPEPEPEPIPAIDQLRSQRNIMLSQTDWWCLSDRTPTNEQLSYRQQLRDLPANSTPELDESGQLTGVDWPTPPNS